MSKTNMRVSRRDGIFDDHVHSMKGQDEKTQGQMLKPSQSTQFPVHTHLYQHEGKTHETGPASSGPGHTHETLTGESSGPQKPESKPSFGPKNKLDEAIRIGTEWVVRNDDGHTIAKAGTKAAAEARAQKLLASE